MGVRTKSEHFAMQSDGFINIRRITPLLESLVESTSEVVERTRTIAMSVRQQG
jgi:hypothetical protein